MESKRIFGFLVAIIALVVLATTSVVATDHDFARIVELEVNGIDTTSDGSFTDEIISVVAGETISVKVVFEALDGVENARIFARIRSSGGLDDSTGEFDVLEGNMYSRTLNVRVPFNIDPDEEFDLIVTIEAQGRFGKHRIVELVAQRASYEVEILSIENPSEIGAGEALTLDVVLKNRGRHIAEDTYVRATITELGISRTVFFGDLYPEDTAADNEEDSVQRRIFLNIPKDVAEGVYTLEVSYFNSDSATVRTKKVFISGAGEESRVVASTSGKSFAVGEDETYTLVIVNAGNTIQVYNLIVNEGEALDVRLDETTVVVPAGSSKVVRFSVSASEEGRHTFSVNVLSEDGQLIDSTEFSANVEGKSVSAGSAAVLLTVVLAIIFVVLLIVLIVLLTRKPEKTNENIGESYY